MLHKEFVVCCSPILKAAFASGLVESQTQIYILEDVEPDTFRLLAEWLYVQKIGPLQDEDGIDSGLASLGLLSIRTRMRLSRRLCELWILADKFQIPQLQNLVMDRLEQRRLQTGSCLIFSYTYIIENTSKSSLLRAYIVDVCVWDMPPSTLLRSSSFPQCLMHTVAVRMCEVIRTGQQKPEIRDMARFHVPSVDASGSNPLKRRLEVR